MALTFEFRRPVEMTLTGVALWLMPGLENDRRSTDWVEIARAPDSSGSPGTWETIARLEPLPSQGRSFTDLRPWTTALWWYRYRHVRADAAVVSAWSTATQHSVSLIPRALENAAEQRIAMTYRATPYGEDGKYAVTAAEADGGLIDALVRFDPANGVFEGGAVHKIYRHREEITVTSDADGDFAVTFAQVYQNAPMIVFRGGQYKTFDTSIGTGVDQRVRIVPINVTATGFTSRAQIASVGATTNQTDDFASGNLLDAVGETAEVNLDPGGANDDTYTVNYRVSVTVDQHATNFCTATLVVAIDINRQDGNGWIETATFSYAVSNVSGPPPFEAATNTWDTEAKQIVVTGLGTNDDIRIRAKSFSVSNSGTGSFAVRGADAGGSNPDTRNGVLYTTASDTVESAIPSTGDQVTWVAQEVL